MAADRPGVEIAKAFIAGKLLGDAVDTNLAFKLFPKNDQASTRIFFQVVAFFTLVISVEDEAVVAVTL